MFVYYVQGIDKIIENRWYRNNTVLAALKEHNHEYLSLLFCLFMLCSASVNALQIVFNNNLYESTTE